MFLKHQDVKQKNWRMRKVKKVFVSSCMLLTVGLGVAVPTGFSQSNGVMVVKAAEVPATDLSRQASDSERVDESSLLQKENLSVDSFKLENLNGWEAENDTAGNLGKFKDPDSSGYQNILTSSGKNISVAVAPKGSGKMNIKVTKRSNFQGGYYVGGLRTQTPVLKLNDVYRYSFTTKKLSGNSSEFKTRVKPVESNNKLGKELVIRVDNKNVSTKHDWLPDISDGTHTVDFTGLDKKLSVAFRFSPRQTSNVVYEFSNINIKNISPASVPAIPSKVLEGTSVLSGTAISSGDTLEKRKSFDGDILRVYKDSKIIARTVIKGNKWDVKLSKPLIAGEKLDFEILHPRSQNVSKKISKQVEAKPFDPASYKEKVIAKLKPVYEATSEKITNDAWLDENAKDLQKQKLEEQYISGKVAISEAGTKQEAIDAAYNKYSSQTDPDSLPSQYKQGNKENEQEKGRQDLIQTRDLTLKAIQEDKWLTEQEKTIQKEEALKAFETGIESVNQTVSLEQLKQRLIVYKASEKDSEKKEYPESIPNQHIPGKEKEVKAAKQEELKKLHDTTLEKINQDKWLTPDQQAEQLKQSKAVDAELKKAIEAVNAADTADKVDDALGEGVTDIKNQHKSGDSIDARREAHGKELDRVAQETKGAIEKDPTLTTEEKAKQVKDVDAAKERGMAKLNEAKDADALDKAYGEGVTDIKNQHKSGDPVDARRGLHNKSIDEVAQATKDAITADTTLTEAEKETQRGNVDKEATKAKEELAKAKDADALDKAYGDGVTSIKNQHKSGKGLDVRKDEHKKALEAVAKRVTAEIEADPTLTPEVREQQKAEVQKELELATDKIAEAKDADEADKAYGDGVTAIENAHVIGKGIEARKDLAKKDLAEAAAKTKALIIEDKTLTDDQRKEQLLGVDTEYAKGIENIDAAKDAAGVDKAYSDGVRDILAQYKEGQNLNDRRNAAKEFLLKEADKVTKLINDDPTLTHDQKVDQINKVEQAKLDAIKSVDDAQTADAINDALGKGIENINNQYQHGDGVDVRKATAKGDLEKEAAKVKALIAKDPTLTQADKDKQTAAVDAAKNTAIAAVDKATTAEGINQELGKGITAINKAYRPGEGVKARKEAAKADLEKEAAKVKALITNDPTLTKADKAKQTEAVAKALKAAIAAVDKATTAEGINQELGKGITAINKAYRPGEGVEAHKEAAKANLEKVAKETKALISGDRYLSETEKAVQKQAVEQALAKALGQVEAAKTVEAVKLAENLGTVAIRSAYVAGLAKDTDQATAALNEAKQAAIEALKQAAAETLAKITTDAKLTEAQKAEQSENVSLALKTAIATVRSAQSIASVKEAKDKGITAIRAAYVPNKAVAKSSSANHLPKSGDANSIVLVGLGVMSLLLGMVLYSKKKESKD
ncbi:TPA: DUF1542 domain-containing protein [Streptococcus pyogenes]|nr:DUF1542 domain-containing protein [Streptococcus pyogenes]HER3517318.1 DUF1542 domain-containing protein [Streptococcus pyogenes]